MLVGLHKDEVNALGIAFFQFLLEVATAMLILT